MTKLPSLTVVAVVGDVVPGRAALERFGAVLQGCAADFELVLVANGAGAGATLGLKRLAGVVPDLTVVFLAEAVHDDMARLVGIEHAVSDYVLFCDVLQDEPGTLPALLAPLRDGYDLVVADRGDERPFRSVLDRVLIRAYGWVYRRITGGVFDVQPTGMRVLSRAASLNVAGRPDAELRLRMRTIGTGFPATVVRVARAPGPGCRQAGHAWSKAVGLLLSASTLPLRGASYAALFGGGLSVLYSLYVFGVYLLRRDVAAGWTTLSLQLSAMMLVFSVVLLFLSEYVIQIYAASPPRSRRYLVMRELRSPLSRRTQRLNVVDGEGVFQLGKPEWLVSESSQV